ncbi:MAG: hypothetical protein EON99_00930, partial [Chitinophagaceae bacterium]
MKIYERILSGNTVTDGYVYDKLSDVNYVWEAELGRISAAGQNQVKYVISSGSTASFLTNKPNYTKVNDINCEQLYFMQDGTAPNLTVRIRTYNKSGGLLSTNTEVIQDLNQYKMYRLNISPKALAESLGLSFTGVHFYVVDIVDSLSKAKTEERVYLYEPLDCGLDYVNLFFVNSLGGLDSYQWVAPQDTVNVNRFIMKRNTASINSDGEYSDISDGVFNPSDVIISNKPSTITRVTSKQLNDSEAYWLQELYTSKQIFVELTDTTLAPALLNNTSYQIPRVKYSKGTLNVIQIEFTLADGIIPTGSHAYSTKKASLEFISSQMNSLTADLPGYGVGVDGDNQYSDEDYQ